ncbi:MAG: Maf family protein [Pseudomonadales bacterium]
MTTYKNCLYLASQSPRRAELLQQIGLEFELLAVDVDETPFANESAPDYVQRLAIAKAQAGWRQLEERGLQALPVLGADTSVVLGEQIMGKPRDRAHGLAMLKSLSDRTHQVMSAVCLCYQRQQLLALNITEVTFRPITEIESLDYWDSGEPLGKAGAYAIQGRAAIFIKRIKGSYSSVVGLPLLETSQLLTQIQR